MATILIVDDDLDIVEVCSIILRLKGHDIRVARNGQEGLDEIQRALPDLILCDVEMPVLTGPDMAYRVFLRNAGAEMIPIILSSAVRDLRAVADAVGTPYFVAKPFTSQTLLAMVDRALAERIPPKPRT